MNESQTTINWLLRDMMQSTGIWTFDSDHLDRLVQHAIEVGFNSLEIGGGQSYQIALQHGFNPYQVLRRARQTVANANATLPIQVLLRGANQLGFKHYPGELQQQNIDLLIAAASATDKANAVIIRNFDALNDAENLRFSLAYMVRCDRAAQQANDAARAAGEVPVAKRVHVQAALSYVRARSDERDACYGIQYYVAYARQLMTIATEAGGQLDSLCIKDMSGQLAPDVARDLVPALKELGLPVYLHCHSTAEAQATATQWVAVQMGIDGIEVAVAPLAGGTSHNDVETVCYAHGVQTLNLAAIARLKASLTEIFGARVAEREDDRIAMGALKRMVAIGVPGGAIPFIVDDLNNYVCNMLGVSLAEALAMFEQEVTAIQQGLGNVPLVTPTADIVAKQAINNLGNGVRADAYRVIDPRFCSLVLGHYGHVNNYATGQRIRPVTEMVEEISDFCRAIEADIDGKRVHAGNVYPEPGELGGHPSAHTEAEDYDLIRDYIDELFRRYPQSCAKFGSREECFALHVMRPAGKTDRLLTRNILGPTEARLRFILDNTLNLLPARDIPESRSPTADEQTDELLLDALGNYDGIVTAIKDLVLVGTTESIRSRLNETMQAIVDPICATNSDARENRYYVERRFVALLASAVFWDLQRICRRTGTDSRGSIDERTAFKLERIIAFTLRKRLIEGRGQARRFLS